MGDGGEKRDSEKEGKRERDGTGDEKEKQRDTKRQTFIDRQTDSHIDRN